MKYSARDDDCKALAIVLENQDELIASKLLALKAHKDIEYDINKKGISDQAGIKGLAAVGSLAYRYVYTLWKNDNFTLTWKNSVKTTLRIILLQCKLI